MTLMIPFRKIKLTITARRSPSRNVGGHVGLNSTVSNSIRVVMKSFGWEEWEAAQGTIHTTHGRDRRSASPCNEDFCVGTGERPDEAGNRAPRGTDRRGVRGSGPCYNRQHAIARADLDLLLPLPPRVTADRGQPSTNCDFTLFAPPTQKRVTQAHRIPWTPRCHQYRVRREKSCLETSDA